jgi:hypothetical protein
VWPLAYLYALELVAAVLMHVGCKSAESQTHDGGSRLAAAVSDNTTTARERAPLRDATCNTGAAIIHIYTNTGIYDIYILCCVWGNMAVMN